MKKRTCFRTSFECDLKRFKRKEKDDSVRADVANAVKCIKVRIEQMQPSQNVHQLPDVKKLRGGRNCFRLRVGDYRIGLQVAEEAVEFVRFQHRRDFYKHFKHFP